MSERNRAWSRVVNGKKCLNSSTVCEVFNISPSTLTRWGADGCPREKVGWWYLTDLMRWRGLVGNAGPMSESAAGTLSLKEQKLKAEADLKKTAAEKEAIRLGELKNEYLPAAQVRRDLEALFLTLRRSFLTLGRVAGMEAAAYVDAPTARRIERVVLEVVHEALEQISVNGIYRPRKTRGQ